MIYQLPWMMLAIRTAPKENLHESSAELVHDALITEPGNHVSGLNPNTNTSEVLGNLPKKEGQFCPIPPPTHENVNVKIHW